MPYTTITAGATITSSWANSNVRDQVVSQFASTAARDAAITSPVNGMVCVTTDTNSVWLRTSSGWTKVGGGGDVRTTLYYPKSFQRLDLAGSILNIGAKAFVLNGITCTGVKNGDYMIATTSVRVQNANALGQGVFTLDTYVGAANTTDAQRLITTLNLGAGDDECLSGTWLYTASSTTDVSFTIQGVTTAGLMTVIAPDTWMTVVHYSQS